MSQLADGRASIAVIVLVQSRGPGTHRRPPRLHRRGESPGGVVPIRRVGGHSTASWPHLRTVAE